MIAESIPTHNARSMGHQIPAPLRRNWRSSTLKKVTIATALSQAVDVLERASIPAPRLTAEVLLCHALSRDRAYLYAHSTDELNELGWIHFGRYLHERLAGKPTQYITRRQEFYGRDFFVSQDVLIPRPETEHLVGAAIAAVREHGYGRILDVGTGSGAIAISVALETGRLVLASDVSLEALQVAERNRAAYRATVAFFAGNLAEAVRTGHLDLLLSNPPYVPATDQANLQREVRDWEPAIALFAGDSGNDIYGRLIKQATSAVRSGGQLMMELGYRSVDFVLPRLEVYWAGIKVLDDLAGLPRVVVAERR
jgi:release factor glutamine methyltransferase